VIGWTVVLLVPGAVALVTERVGWCGSRFVAGMQLLLPWWTVFAVAIAAAGAVAHDAWLAVAGVVEAVAIVAVIAPKLFRVRPVRVPPVAVTAFSVGLANLYLDNPEPEAAARQLLAAAPAVLVLTELTPQLLDAFDRVGGAERYPHRVHREPPRDEYEAGIFSVYPFAAATVREDAPLRVVDATVTLPDGVLRVLAVHPEAPTSRHAFRTWRTQLAALGALLTTAAPATVVLGDFNAGTLQPPYEALLRTPFRDAHDVMGTSLAPSWGVAPSLPRWVPTFVARLDHLLVGTDIAVLEVRDLDPVGSDHRPFVASLALLR
jgi:endonuclease/exonuclease/phosphatase (EEP) superfamily protein YafD